MSWGSLVNHAATRNKKRMEEAGFSLEGTEAVAELFEIEEKLPGVELPKDVREAIVKQKESA